MTSLNTPTTTLRSQQNHLRFVPVVHLLAGDMLGMAAEEAIEFEERVSFGPAGLKAPEADAAKWLADRLSRIASAAWEDMSIGRPILVPAPMAALSNANTAVACDAAIRRTSMCQQEFCLMFPDTAFAAETVDCASRVARLRKAGFRVGIDMRRSWHTPLTEGLRLMIDTIRVDADELEASPDLQEIVMVARESGILVVADNANWRDGTFLEETGIAGAVAPRTDA
ncbi:EAL domain-containing protein [Hyphomonas sp. WL0036]|uniref:EAL domain-containing protein n=1 Tax=Hyphomonas sediminis TaxID=2866160 RepID=UPI001C7EE5F6|nr:EAL domain-containing protein [Hyphomonas sediminis]